MVTKADINLNLALVSLTEIDIILKIVYRSHIPQLAIVLIKVKVYFQGVQTSAKLRNQEVLFLIPSLFQVHLFFDSTRH